MKLTLIEYNKRKNFLQILCRKRGGETSSRALSRELVVEPSSRETHDQRRIHIWLLKIFRCRKLIIFTEMSLSCVWKLYQRKKESVLIVVVLFISWIVLGIIRKSKKIWMIRKIYDNIITLQKGLCQIF